MLKLLFLLFTIVSCSNNEENPPTWFINEEQNTANTLYGTGEALNKDQSVENALANLKEKIYTSVSSQSIMQNTFVDEKTANEYRKTVKIKTPQITFRNYKIEKTTLQNNTYYTIVSVNKNQLVETVFDNLTKQSQKITPKIEQYHNTKNIIKKVIIIQDISQKCNEYMELERFYNALGFAMEENLCNEMITEYNQFQNKYIIEITNTNPVVHDTLSYVFAKKFTLMQKANYTITYKTNIKTTQIEDKYLSALTIQIIQHNANDIFEKKCIGSSFQSAKNATDMAFESCLNQAKDQTFEEFFNI